MNCDLCAVEIKGGDTCHLFRRPDHIHEALERDMFVACQECFVNGNIYGRRTVLERQLGIRRNVPAQGPTVDTINQVMRTMFTVDPPIGQTLRIPARRRNDVARIAIGDSGTVLPPPMEYDTLVVGRDPIPDQAVALIPQRYQERFFQTHQQEPDTGVWYPINIGTNHDQ